MVTGRVATEEAIGRVRVVTGQVLAGVGSKRRVQGNGTVGCRKGIHVGHETN